LAQALRLPAAPRPRNHRRCAARCEQILLRPQPHRRHTDPGEARMNHRAAEALRASDTEVTAACGASYLEETETLRKGGERSSNPRSHTKKHEVLHKLFLFVSLRATSRIHGVAILCASAPLWFSLPAFGQNIKLPPVTRTSLDNGIRLVLMEYHK